MPNFFSSRWRLSRSIPARSAALIAEVADAVDAALPLLSRILLNPNRIRVGQKQIAFEDFKNGAPTMMKP